MNTITDELLKEEVYALPLSLKKPLFLKAMKESLLIHQSHCAPYRSFLESYSFDPCRMERIEDIPPLSVSVFKELDLFSVHREEISSIIHSSATTSGKPSVIFLDALTTRRQQNALRAIMESFIGIERLPFIVFDDATIIKRGGADTPSRSSAVRGFLSFAKSLTCVLNQNLTFDVEHFESALYALPEGSRVSFFGFTWVLYRVWEDLKMHPALKARVRKALLHLGPGSMLLHLGGWKKLTDINIDKKMFNQRMSEFLGIAPENCMDIYGMTEQLGTIYPDCSAGHKHAPAYADILIRDISTLESLPTGCEGFIELLSPLPHSYPGVALISDDLGELCGEDDCPCGRKGKYFTFTRRSNIAPLKGCGDTLL